jgi:hypothetical protein
MFASDLFGLPIPAAGPIFAVAVTIHIGAGLTAVVAGALAATARKCRGRHPRAGRVYLWALTATAATACVLAVIRWQHDAHLFVMAVVAAALGWYGYRARRQHRPGWPIRHAIGMAGSFVVLLTAFYVDNGPFLPVWDRLPHLTYWLLPSLIGIPTTWMALGRYLGRSRRVQLSAHGWSGLAAPGLGPGGHDNVAGRVPDAWIEDHQHGHGDDETDELGDDEPGYRGRGDAGEGVGEGTPDRHGRIGERGR